MQYIYVIVLTIWNKKIYVVSETDIYSVLVLSF